MGCRHIRVSALLFFRSSFLLSTLARFAAPRRSLLPTPNQYLNANTNWDLFGKRQENSQKDILVRYGLWTENIAWQHRKCDSGKIESQSLDRFPSNYPNGDKTISRSRVQGGVSIFERDNWCWKRDSDHQSSHKRILIDPSKAVCTWARAESR